MNPFEDTRYQNPQDRESFFMGQKIESPLLNITSFFLAQRSLDLEKFERSMTWVWSNETYDYEYVSSKGTCQPTGVSDKHTLVYFELQQNSAKLTLWQNYQWGFSFIQLFIMNMMLLMWTTGILIMWSRAKVTMHERGRNTSSGEHKAVLELASAMRMELSNQDVDLTQSAEEAIERRIRDVNGGRVLYASPLLVKPPARTGVIVWFTREKWWLLATSVSFTITATIWLFDFWLMIWWIGPTFGLIMSLEFGSTNSSRSSVVLIWTILSVLVVQALFYGWRTV